MSLSCGGSLMKYILFFFNIIFFLLGGVMLGTGIWLKVDPNVQHNLAMISVNVDKGGDLMNVAIWVMIGVGAFIFLVGFLGCCGACQESSCMLCLYIVFVSLILVLEITAAILAIVFRTKLGAELQESMTKQVKELKPDYKDVVTITWNTVQYNFKCCGANNYTDYVGSKFGEGNPSVPIPPTCCKMDNLDAKDPKANDYAKCKSDFDTRALAPTELYTKGCYNSLNDWVNSHAGIIIGVAIAFALIQILVIVFACCVRNEIEKGV